MNDLGDWDLLDVVGVGAHAVVHRAVHRDRPGRVVAVKRLRDVDPAGVDALRREADLLADLAHPAIAVLHEVVTDGDGVALILALATGGSLAQRLDRPGTLPAQEVVDLGRRLASALAAAHDVGVLHRDVKPDNVVYGREDEPRLADFGLATAIDLPPTEIAGTSTWLDPEVANGAPPSPASDTWSLAVVLWQAVAGQAPWLGADDLAVRRAADRGLHLPLDQLAPTAPPALVAVLERAVLRDPHRRFRHPQQLEQALAGVQVRSRDPGRSPGSAGPVGGHDATSSPGPVAPPGPAPDRGPDDTPVAPVAPPAPTGPAPSGDPGEPVEPDAAGTPAPPAPPGVPNPAPHPAPHPAPASSAGGATREASRPAGPASPDRAGQDPPGEVANPTRMFGRRPPPPVDAPEPGRRWSTRVVVALAVVVPLLVAAWAWAATREDQPGSADASVTADDPTGPGVDATASPTSPAGPAVDRPRSRSPAPSGSVESDPSRRGGSSPAPTPPATSSRVPAAVDPSSSLPVGWTPREPEPACAGTPGDGAPTSQDRPDDRVLSADVGGFGCSVDVTVGSRQVAGRPRIVLVVPEGAGPLAGRYDLGPPGDTVVFGDWDGDGADTPAVVRADTGAVYTFRSWGDLRGEATGQRPVRTRPAVATDDDGVDHVVDAVALETSPPG